MKIVIIGLGTAAFSAVLAIRKNDRNSDITIIDNKDFDLQHNCGLPYALEGLIDIKKLEHTIDSKNMKLKILSRCKAIKIDKDKKEIGYSDNGKNKKMGYDKLLLDTGSEPFLPPIEGLKDNNSVFVVKTSKDVKKLEKAIKDAKKATVIGAGAIGLEVGYALMKKGLKVTIAEALPAILPRAIDEDISDSLKDYLNKEGIEVILNAKIEKIDNKDVIIGNKKISSDIIINAAGVRSNTKLAKEAGLKTSKFGIIVDKSMKTSDKDIYAAGDCAECFNTITKEKYPGLLATIAYKQGTIAGKSIIGKKAEFKGSINTFASVIGDIEVSATGLNSFSAKEAGYDIIVGKSISNDKPEWFPSSSRLMLKIISNNKGRVLGAQAIGSGTASRINIIATAIKAGMTLKELSEIELTYCPALSQTYDIIIQAADIALRKIK